MKITARNSHAACFALLFASGTGIAVAEASNPVQVGCEIVVARNTDGTQIDAVISASGAVSGTYKFDVKPAGGGEPLFEEAKEFNVASDSPSSITTSRFKLPAGKGFNASLSAKWPNGSSSCSSSGS